MPCENNCSNRGISVLRTKLYCSGTARATRQFGHLKTFPRPEVALCWMGM